MEPGNRLVLPRLRAWKRVGLLTACHAELRNNYSAAMGEVAATPCGLTNAQRSAVRN